MKPAPLLLKRNVVLITFIFCLPFFIYSCAAVGKTESPLSAGVGAYLTPGIQIGDSKFSAHALLGYERIWANGGGGYNNFWMVGAQGRYSFSDDPDANGIWVGGEIAYLAISYKNTSGSFPKATANGYTASAVGGYRFMISTVPVSVYIAPGYFARSAFNSSGGSGGGFHGRIGFDIHFASLLGKKWR